jgi:hypothetical protein
MTVVNESVGKQMSDGLERVLLETIQRGSYMGTLWLNILAQVALLPFYSMGREGRLNVCGSVSRTASLE